jgi:hypothetical protein
MSDGQHKLRVIVDVGGERRLFTMDARAPASDLPAAIEAGVRAFSKAFNGSLDLTQAAHAARMLERTEPTA